MMRRLTVPAPSVRGRRVPWVPPRTGHLVRPGPHPLPWYGRPPRHRGGERHL